MFGFVVANPEKLSQENNHRYKAVYCGICEDLAKNRGFKCRFTLTYDLVFLAIVLSSVNSEGFNSYSGRCPMHPTKKRTFYQNKYTSFASDMNLALAYYKYLDDKEDDKSLSAVFKSSIFKKEQKKIEKKYPEQCQSIKKCLKELEEAERHNILIPDVPADIFGKLLGNIFALDGSVKKTYLYDLGYSLGKFIYIMDAAVDLESDIKKQKYNPLVMYSKKDIEPILTMLLAECTQKYEKLELKQDKEIIENILFSGVWTAYLSKEKGKKSEQRPL